MGGGTLFKNNLTLKTQFFLYEKSLLYLYLPFKPLKKLDKNT